MAGAMNLARNLARNPPSPRALGRAPSAAKSGLPLDRAYASAGAAMVATLLDADTAEGIDAFLDKRPPHWS